MILEEVTRLFKARGLPVASAPFSQVARKPVEGAVTVLITALPYYFPTLPEQNLARFAALPDYHGYFGDLLKEIAEELKSAFPQGTFLPYTDNSPIDEQKAALLSGLAAKGKNNLCITEKGSFVFLGEIVTNLEISLNAAPPKLLCDSCRRCIQACPNGALTETGFQFERCLAYLTQKKGELTPEERDAVAKNRMAWGCDRCSEVCPHNARLQTAPIALPPNEILPRLTIKDVESHSDRRFREIYKNRAFAWRGKATMLRNLYILEESNHGKTQT